MSRTLWAAVVAVCVGLAAGCGGSPNTAAALDREQKGALEELGLMLKTLAEEGRKPPAKAADLDAVDPMIPTAGAKIRTGELVYAWGAGYAAGGTQVIAWEKGAAEQGGYVLLQDGTVKRLSAGEFQSAPKAK